MIRKRRRTAPGEPVGGLQPEIADIEDGAPEKYELKCPQCGAELGRFRFPLLAQRRFEEQVDEEHPAAAA